METRELSAKFTTEHMRPWYSPQNYLHVSQEQLITAEESIEQILARIVRDLEEF